MKTKIKIIILLFVVTNAIFAQDQYIGEIKLMSTNFAPQGWALCNGQLLLINQNQALFSILGTTYGGNGQTNFALPDLRGKIVVGVGPNRSLGQLGTQVATTLAVSNIAHVHSEDIKVSNAQATSQTPTAGGALGAASMVISGSTIPVLGYNTSAPNVGLPQAATSSVGEASPTAISTIQPVLGLTYMIALIGVYPTQN